MKRFFNRLLGQYFLVSCGGVSLLLSGCVGPQSFSDVQDSGPKAPINVSHIPDAQPKYEVQTQAGNKSPYSVLGKTYRVMPDAKGFKQEGLASWYGRKFHGRRTSNGEVYDMYGMTAAHKTLPIPCYVKVTNRENGHSVIVRVNDRGPFHDGRIIDLSYSAAAKLGFAQRGTAPVEIEVITPDSPASARQAFAPKSDLPLAEKAPTPVNSNGYQLPPNTYLQAGAYSTALAAQNISQRVSQLVSYPVQVTYNPQLDALYRVKIGPIADNWELMQIRELLQKNQLPVPHVVYDQ